MFNKNLIITVILILIIFSIGFALRIESTKLHGVNNNDQDMYRDYSGKPYMYELDSYYNYRLTKNYLENGYLGDKFVDGVEWDSYSYYPPGVPMDYPPLIVYLTSFIYTIINYFTNTSLLTICFWLPAFIAPLAGIITYLFVKRFSDNVAGLTAGILIVISPLYLLRTAPGWFDTDMFNLIFPILIVWFFMESIHNKNIKNKYLFSFASAFALFLFSMAWNGWQYIFYIITGFTLIYIIWYKIKGKQVKECLIVLLIFIISSLTLISLLTGYINVIKPFSSLLDFSKLLGVHNPWYPWPNLYINIKELQIPSLDEIVSDVGLLLFFLGIMGFLLILRLMANKNMMDNFLKTKSSFFYLFLLIWLVIGFFSISKGARFIILIIPPLAISSGIAMGILLNYLKNYHKNKKIVGYLSIILILVIIIPQCFNAYTSLVTLKPAAEDDLWNSAQWINYNTANNTVIISDWSYGHFLSAIADRPVFFDGRSAYIETLPVRKFYGDNLTFNGKIPNTSREYWISHAFSTTNETLSAGIFRMLASSGDYAYLTLDEYTNNTTQSVTILNEILGLDRKSAKDILLHQYFFDEQKTSNILQYTHPLQERPFVLLTYDRMIDTGKWDFYFGNWDFQKQEGGNYTYSYTKLTFNNSNLNLSNNITGNFDKGNLRWNNKDPYCIIQVRNGTVKKRYINSESNFCIILQFDSEKAVIIDKEFENSVFTKLILEKVNTNCFKMLYKNKKSVVWKVTSC